MSQTDIRGFHGATALRLMIPRVAIGASGVVEAVEYEGLDLPAPVGSDEGTDATIAAMSEIVRDAVGRARSALLWLGPSIKHTPFVYRAQQVYSAINSMRFVEDPAGQELLQHPLERIADSMRRGAPLAGDCDDRAMMGAAYLTAADVPACFIVMGRDPNGRFEHVCCGWDASPEPRIVREMNDPRGDITGRIMQMELHTLTLDPQTGTPLGSMPAGVRRVKVYPVV